MELFDRMFPLHAWIWGPHHMLKMHQNFVDKKNNIYFPRWITSIFIIFCFSIEKERKKKSYNQSGQTTGHSMSILSCNKMKVRETLLTLVQDQKFISYQKLLLLFFFLEDLPKIILHFYLVMHMYVWLELTMIL